MKFIIYGRIPSKKNSTINFVRGGRIMHIPSNQYREWHKSASAQLVGVKGSSGKNIHSVSILFYSPDKRKTDLTNKTESIMDMLVDNNVLPDDNWEVVPRLLLRHMGLDKENPRAEITINYEE